MPDVYDAKIYPGYRLNLDIVDFNYKYFVPFPFY